MTNEPSKLATDMAEDVMRHIEQEGGFVKEALARQFDYRLGERNVRGGLMHPEVAPPPVGDLDHPSMCVVSMSGGDFHIGEDLKVEGPVTDQHDLPLRVVRAQLEMARRILNDEANPVTETLIYIGNDLLDRLAKKRGQTDARIAAIKTIIFNLRQIGVFSEKAANDLAVALAKTED